MTTEQQTARRIRMQTATRANLDRLMRQDGYHWKTIKLNPTCTIWVPEKNEDTQDPKGFGRTRTEGPPGSQPLGSSEDQ